MQSSTRTVNDPAFRAAINDVAAAVKGNPAIKNLKSPLDPENRDQVSKNRRTAIVTWNMKGKADVAKKKIDGIEASVVKVGDRHPGFYVGEAGSVSSGKDTRQDVRRPAEAGRRALHPGHDRRAPARLRRVRRRRRPAAAGALGCDRNDWLGPIPSPPPSGTPCTSWGQTLL